MARGYRSTLKAQPAPRGKSWQTRWSKAMRAAFLDHLAGTCNVSHAAAAAGVFPATVYAARRRDPEFAAQWEEALALGYQMVETRLVGHVLEGRGWDEPVEGGDPDDPGGIDFDAALRLLSQHRNAQGKPHRGRQPQFAAPEETDKMLLKRLAHIEARRAREASWAAAVAAGKAAPPGEAAERGAGDGE